MRRTLRLRHPLKHLVRRLALGRDGATAVEFALVALPFFALLMALIELGMIFLISNSLESATYNTARQIRTGELQIAGGATATTFAAQICAQQDLSWLGGQCAANLSVDVRTFTQFANTNLPSPVVAGQFNKQALEFQMGGPGDIVLVRAFYRWSLIAPMIDGAVQQMGDGSMLIGATSTFRNEPYPTTP